MKKLIELKRQAQIEIEGQQSGNPRISILTGGCDAAAGSLALTERFATETANREITARIVAAGSLGWRQVEPLVAIDSPGNPRIFYPNVTPELVSELVATLVDCSPRLDLALATDAPGGLAGVPELSSLPFFATQRRVALRNVGTIDPEDLNDALAHDAYAGLERALAMSPEALIAEIQRTGLRTRGSGAQVAHSWRLCRETDAGQHFLIADAAYGFEQSGPYDLLLEGDPHALLEGILIAAYASGANRAYLCIDPESNLAMRRAQLALEQSYSAGLAGDDILGSGFCCQIEICAVPRRLAAAEDTILISALAGRRPQARACPPAPESEGLFAKPTVVQDVESLALLAPILTRDADACGEFRETRIVQLGGALIRTGFVEVPVGTPLSKIVEIAGGPLGSGLKAVQIGGPAGGWIPAANLDIALTADEMLKAGCTLGSASIFAATGETCAVDLARQAAVAAHSASCGKCSLGREGTRQMMDILTDLARGRGARSDLDLLLDIGDAMKAGSLCANGRNAPDAVLTTLQYFRSEFSAHVEAKHCPAHVCTGSETGSARMSR
jgi:NADH:ubiquinone oxidoreductase subunit F (NADH-binding)